MLYSFGLFFLSFFFTTSSFALILIDDMMTKEEQKKTGLYYLNHNQRRALEKWLNDHVILKTAQTAPQEASKAPSGQKLFLSLNIQGGKQLQLSDGSVYEIAPSDINVASGWITPIPIEISQSGYPDYPYLLTNKNTDGKVRAKLVTQPSP